MEQVISIFIDIGEQGLIYGVLVLGLLISYRILNIPDLTVDGSFPLGAAVSAVLLTRGVNPWLALFLSLLAGMLAGLSTGLLNVKLKISYLLSGIVVMTMLYSVNLVIAGRSNLPLFDMDTIFNSGPASGIPQTIGAYRLRTLIVSLILIVIVKLFLDFYLQTRQGLLLRSAGSNQQLVIGVGRDPGMVRVLGFVIGNGLVALSGGILAQQQGFFELSMGTGQMVNGIASLIIGVLLFKKSNRIKLTTQVIIGSIIYKALITLAINLGLGANFLKLGQGILFLLILVTSNAFDKEGRHATASTRE